MQCMVERECSGVLDWAVSVQLVAGAGVRKPRLPVSAWVSVWGPGTVYTGQLMGTVSWRLVSAGDDGLVTRGITTNTTTTRKHSTPSANLTFPTLTFNWLDVFFRGLFSFGNGNIYLSVIEKQCYVLAYIYT